MQYLPDYYWITLAVTFALLMYVPTKLRKADNLYGSLIVAMFGFVLWPLVAYAAFVTYRKRKGTST